MPGDTQQRIQKKFLRNKHNGRQEIDLYMKKKKISLRKIILLLMILGCLTSAVAIILTSYSSLQLIQRSREQEKEAQQMEYEKLVYQINPHFLLNVLNSIQWMAQMSHQKDIGEYTSALKKLLSYNLGKEGRETTLRKEIEMVKNYIFLQQKRYDFEVDISVEEGEYLNVPTVRMMLQPLVENAIRYGLGEEGKIAIQTFFDKKRNLVAVTIEDFGHGLSQKEIDEINEPFGYRWNTGKENRGIGIRYVKAMLSTFYQGNADLFVNSKRGTGTKITIILPAAKEVDEHECFDRR